MADDEKPEESLLLHRNVAEIQCLEGSGLCCFSCFFSHMEFGEVAMGSRYKSEK